MNIKKTFNELSFLCEILKPYIYKYVLAVFIVMFSSILGLVQIYLMKNVIDKCILSNNLNLLIKTILIIVGIFALVQVLYIVKTLLFVNMSERILYDFRISLYEKILSKDLSFHGHKSTGELMTRIMEEVPTIINFILNVTIDVVTMVVTAIIILILMLKLSMMLTLVSIISLTITFITMRYFGKILKSIQNKSLIKYSEVSSVLNENLQNVKTIKYLRKYEYASGKLKTKLKEHIDIKLKIRNFSIALSVVLSFLNFIPNITLLGIGGYMAIKGILSVGTILVLLNYMQQFIQTIQNISNIHIDYQMFSVAVNRFNEILKDKEQPNEMTEVVNVEKNIRFENISFSYHDKLIIDLNQNINLGSIVKITGMNGKGKSTLANLLYRLIKPEKGEIYIDNKNLLDIKEECMAKITGIVPQEIQLFSSSVLENIVLGDNITKNEILEIAKKVGFDSFDEKFLSKNIVNRGINISGGEKQKIGIIRALVRNPKILILDEADKSLDKESTGKLYNYINNNKKEKIVFIITHGTNNEINSEYNINF